MKFSFQTIKDFGLNLIQKNRGLKNKFSFLNFKLALKGVGKFLNSTFLQTIAIVIVGYLAFNVAIKQNDISKQLILLSSSPSYSQALTFSIFESDLRIKNVSKVSLHNVQPQFVDIYDNPNTIQLFGGMETIIYDMQPGQSHIITIPEVFKTEDKTVSIQICYLYNDDPFDVIDSTISPWELEKDPFYESNRRFLAYDNYACSAVIVKYEDESYPAILTQ